MKKLFTLLSMLVLAFAVNAQQSFVSNQSKVDKNGFVTGNHQLHKYTGLPNRKHIGQGSRNASTSVMLDNSGVDGAYATLIGTDEYYVNFLDINKNYPNSTFGTHRWAIALFDSLLYINQATTLPEFLPRKTTTLHLDSFDIYFVHDHKTTNPDTIHFQIFDRDSMKLTGTGNTANLTGNKRWDTTIITNTTIPLNVNDNTGTPTWTALTFYPNLQFALGKTFGYRVDFSGDTANKFNLTASFRDDCGQAELASNSAVNSPTYTNSLYYINAIIPSSGQNISGINSVGFNYPTCPEWYAQNWWVYPYVTADVAYSAAIVSDSLKGCPGTVLNLTAYGFGTTATPVTYSWATTSGTLSTSTDQNVSLVINGNATVTVTVTDAASATTTATVSVVSRGISVTITNPNPYSIACSSTGTVTTTLTGIQTGKNYTWSTGATGTSVFSIPVTAPGAYSVTVTNNSGCSSSATVNVVYPGVTNNVNFNLPAPPVCKNVAVTFTNTSSQYNSPWAPTWDMLNDGSQLQFSTNATYAYTSAGTYTVKLTMDSAGCKFTKTRTVNVSTCTGIEDVAFDNSISLLPNPSNGNIIIAVNGIEKNLSIKVYNIIGSEVKNFAASDVSSAFSKSFDFSDLTNGTYLVKIQSADKSAVKRFTVSK